jgi:Fe-Mn family superoxide dismutase
MDNYNNMTYPFETIPLNYNYSALEPYIDAATVQVHYVRHLGAYIENLNTILDSRPELHGMTLKELILTAASSGETDLLNNAGGVYNHFFYFSQLRPATGQIVIGITPSATAKVNESFGSWKSMKDKFSAAGLEVFGSGYAWLVKRQNGLLDIVTTPNQNTPLESGATPVLALDVWEHAYYLKHLNERKAYIDAFWNVVDWVKFSNKVMA